MDGAVYERGKEYGRKVLSLLMALAMVFSMVSSLTISASAASQSERVLYDDNHYYGPEAEFWIGGNLITHKKVTIKDVYLACGQGLVYPKAEKWYQENTRYHVWVYKKDNEHIYKSYCLKMGEKFKLPIGRRDWKVTIQPERTKSFSRAGYEKSLWSFARYKISY